MQTITIGQQHYKWTTTVFNWLERIECSIYNIVDPKQRLIIVYKGIDPEICSPRQIRTWVDFALTQGWYRSTFIYEMIPLAYQVQIRRLVYSLSEQQAVVDALAKRFNKQTPALEKSNLKYELQNLEEQLGYTLPQLLQQVYLNLGNGNFGPDYGFFSLNNLNDPQRPTLHEAYQSLHQQAIQDWDWKLPSSMLPFLDWGTDIYSLVDCSTPNAVVYTLDQNLKRENTTWESCLWEHTTLLAWLQKWLEGDVTGRALWMEMYQLRGLV